MTRGLKKCLRFVLPSAAPPPPRAQRPPQRPLPWVCALCRTWGAPNPKPTPNAPNRPTQQAAEKDIWVEKRQSAWVPRPRVASAPELTHPTSLFSLSRAPPPPPLRRLRLLQGFH